MFSDQNSEFSDLSSEIDDVSIYSSPDIHTIPHAYNKPLPPPPIASTTESKKMRVFKSVVGKIKNTASAAINYTYTTYNTTVNTTSGNIEFYHYFYFTIFIYYFYLLLIIYYIISSQERHTPEPSYFFIIIYLFIFRKSIKNCTPPTVFQF